MAININKKEGDKLHAEEWNELAQEVMGKQPRLNIVDDLNSDSSVDVLSAKQGKVLDEKINSATSTIEGISEKVDKLPTGYYYGQFDSVSGLPDVSQSTQKGYAYVASEDPSIYYIYLFEGEGSSWEDSGNKFVTTTLEDDLSTKSESKAPTTKVVAESIEEVDLTKAKTASTELTSTQKYNVNANISNRIADVEAETGVVKALGYKVLDPRKSFAEQVTDANTVYEVKDEFDLNNGSVTIPIGCTLRFNGGKIVNGSLNGSKTIVETNLSILFVNVTILGTWVVAESCPENFGAIGDGTVDDTNAVNNAIFFGRKIVFTNNYRVDTMIVPQNKYLYSTNNSTVYYNKVNINGDGVQFDGIVFDGELSTRGVSIFGSNITINNCSFINTKADEDGIVTSAIFIGSYYTEEDEIHYTNILISNCIFDTAEPYDTSWSGYTNSMTARFILSYAAKEVKIQNNIFKGLSGLKDSDCIQLRALQKTDSEFPFGGTPAIGWSGTNPYNSLKYEQIGCSIANNTFYLNNTKSGIKVTGSNVVVSGNIFYSAHTDTDETHSQEAIVRFQVSEGITVQNNTFVLNNTKIIKDIIRFSQIRNGIISNNAIYSEGVIEKVSLIGMIWSHNIKVTNNNFNIKADNINIFEARTNGFIEVNNNVFNLNISNTTLQTVNCFDTTNYSICPTSEDNGEKFIFEKNQVMCFGKSDYFLAEVKYEKSIILRDNNIVANRMDIITRVITIVGGKSNVEINNNQIECRVTVQRNSNFRDGDVEFLADNCEFNILSLYSVKKVTINNSKFKNLYGNYFIVFSNSNDNHFNSVSFNSVGSKNHFRIDSGACVLTIDNVYAESIFPKVYKPSDSTGTLSIDVKSAKSGIPNFTIGSFSDKPLTNTINYTLNLPDNFKYYATDIKEEITWDGTIWTNAEGEPAGLKKMGTSLERPSNANASFRYFDITLGKPIYWNGTAWVDSNGETVGLQVSDTSVLIGAAAGSKTVSVYYGGSTAPTIAVLNSDDTANTWLTATPDPFTGNTLTLTATANDTSAPRGAKVLVILGDELVIINVVQSF